MDKTVTRAGYSSSTKVHFKPESLGSNNGNL